MNLLLPLILGVFLAGTSYAQQVIDDLRVNTTIGPMVVTGDYSGFGWDGGITVDQINANSAGGYGISLQYGRLNGGDYTSIDWAARMLCNGASHVVMDWSDTNNVVKFPYPIQVPTNSIPLSYLTNGGATNGQVLGYNGTAWVPANSGGGASLPSTTSILKGNGSGGAAAATAGTDYPGLGTANTFTTNQTVNGAVNATSFVGSGSGLTNIPSSALVGSTNGSNAATGFVGEYMTATGTNSAITSAAVVAVTNVTLTPGDWDVSGLVEFTMSGATVTAQTIALHTTSGAFPAYSSPGFFSVQGISTSAGFCTWNTGVRRFLVTTNTAVYLNVSPAFTGGTVGAIGTIQARRLR